MNINQANLKEQTLQQYNQALLDKQTMLKKKPSQSKVTTKSYESNRNSRKKINSARNDTSNNSKHQQNPYSINTNDITVPSKSIKPLNLKQGDKIRFVG